MSIILAIRDKHVIKIIISLAMILSIIFSLGCGGFSITGGPGRNASPSLKSQSTSASQLLTINSLFISQVEISEAIALDSENKFDFSSQLRDVVRAELDLRVYYSGSSSNTLKSEVNPLIEAKRVRADAILYTKVTNFIKREGSAIGSDQPAQVDFSMQIVRVSDGKTIWNSSYHFKDQSLSENLFKIEDRLSKGSTPQFQSAEELIKKGYRSALSDFSKQRLAQFSVRP